MTKQNFQVVYLIGVSVLLILFNFSKVDLNSYTFLITSFGAALAVGLLGVYLFASDWKIHKNLFFWSYLFTLGFLYSPGAGSSAAADEILYGFPSPMVAYHTTWERIELNLIGFAVNFFIIYFVLKFLTRKLRKLARKASPGEA